MGLRQKWKDEPGKGFTVLVEEKLGCKAGWPVDEQLNDVVRNNLHGIQDVRWQKLEDGVKFTIEFMMMHSSG